MSKKLLKVELFTDGACRGNPGPGGWGVLMRYKDHEKVLKGGDLNTTNNKMELTAAIEGLKALKFSSEVIIITDSIYLKNGITDWINNWQKNNWKTANKKLVKNKDLWEKLLFESQKHKVKWNWVKAHNGHRYNEFADRLANEGIDEMLNNKGI